MTILGTVENDTIKLPPGVHLRDGLQVRIETLLLNADNSASRWPANYFTKTSGSLSHEQLERPDQGAREKREAW